MLRPSTAILVTSDTTLAECVRRMRDAGIGSLLVVSHQDNAELVGIFTERDLLKWIDPIQHGSHWDKPVSVLMNKKLITLSIYELNQAPQIMIDHHIRHVPVVYQDGEGKTRVLGLISMRDVFRQIYDQAKDTLLHEADSKRPRSIVLVSKEQHSRDTLKLILEQKKKAELVELPASELTANPEASLQGKDLLLLDIDHHGPKEWTDCLQAAQKFSKNNPGLHTLIVFDHALHSPQNVQMLKSFAGPKTWMAFAKPLNVLELLQQIRIWLT